MARRRTRVEMRRAAPTEVDAPPEEPEIVSYPPPPTSSVAEEVEDDAARVETTLKRFSDSRVHFINCMEVDLSHLRGVVGLDHACDPELVDRLLPLTRVAGDDDATAALNLLRTLDDPRVFPELFANLAEHRGRSEWAYDWLLDGHWQKPESDNHDAGKWRERLRQRQRVFLWGRQFCSRLMALPVRLSRCRDGLGKTNVMGHGVDLQVADTALAENHPHGEDVLRGLVVHELGHHLVDVPDPDFIPTWRKAHTEGLTDLLNVLVDERMERHLKARFVEVRPWLDRLASYAFTQRRHRIDVTELAAMAEQRGGADWSSLIGDRPPELVRRWDGEVVAAELDNRQFLALAGPRGRLVAFLLRFRGGWPASQFEPVVNQAAALVPTNLRMVGYPRLLELARKIRDLLGPDACPPPMRLLVAGGEPGTDPGTGPQGDADSGRCRALVLRRVLGNMAAGPFDEQQLTEFDAFAMDRGGTSDGEYDVTDAISKPITQDESTAKTFNLNPGKEFNEIPEECTPPQSGAHRALVQKVGPHVGDLRRLLERVFAGRRHVEDSARRGTRLDRAEIGRMAYRPVLEPFLPPEQERPTEAFVYVIIDRSGSMSGSKMELAKAFGMLTLLAMSGLPRLEVMVSAFDDRRMYHLGGSAMAPTAWGLATLDADNGNNDSGALAYAARRCLASSKTHRLILMISDGMPTECTFESLANLVRVLTTQHRVVCAKVAVDTLSAVAFPNAFFDLTDHANDFGAAVGLFADLLMRLTSRWRVE